MTWTYVVSQPHARKSIEQKVDKMSVKPTDDSKKRFGLKYEKGAQIGTALAEYEEAMILTERKRHETDEP